jgi:hypothetical protein
MSDEDREREVPPRVERETTVVTSGDGGGGGGAIVAVVVILVVVVLLFIYFGGFLGRTSSTELNVNIDTPKVELPDVKVDVHPPATQPAQPAQPSNPPANSQ